MIIAQITDLHLSTPGSKVDVRFRTAEHLEKAVAHLLALDPRPDLVLATGDLVEDGETAEYERLAELLAPLPMPLYFIPGNHDERENLRAVLGPGGGVPAEGRFIQYVVEGWPVRLIALDTLLPGKSRGELCEERLAWLEARLAEAPERPTLIFMHHPPFQTGLWHMDKSAVTAPERLGAVVARHSQVERIVCGHLHRPILRRWYGTVVSVCPSTCHQIALDLRAGQKLGVIGEPPACQLHVWFQGDGLVTHTSYIEPNAVPEPMYPG